MNLLEYSHTIKMSSKEKNDIIIRRIEAEKIILLLSSPNRPQFILVDGSLLNTSFIVGVIETPEISYSQLSYTHDGENRELTHEEKLIHQQYLNHINLVKKINL